jgi:hypothetical protein
MYEGEADVSGDPGPGPGEGGPGAVVWVAAEVGSRSSPRSSVVADWEGEAGENG